MLIDSHAHLTSERFDKDRDKIIKNFKRNGLEAVITSGSSFASSVAAVSLAKKYDNIYATIGIHPNNTDDIDDNTLAILASLSKDKKVVGIGEIGLDYHYDYSPKDVQKKWFIKQIELAKSLGLPIVIHDREANIDTYNIVKEYKDENLRGVLHCYSGDIELARKYNEIGFYISISGPVTYNSAHKLKRVAKETPLEFLFVETDCPSLTPGPVGRKRNEPIYVSYVASMIAELKGIPLETVENQTTNNVKRLFGI